MEDTLPLTSFLPIQYPYNTSLNCRSIPTLLGTSTKDLDMRNTLHVLCQVIASFQAQGWCIYEEYQLLF